MAKRKSDTRSAVKTDMTSNSKAEVIGLLNEQLAAAIDLALVTKQAHWNIKGAQFIAVHEMLDMFRAELDTHVDTIAERIPQLGGLALGIAQTVASMTPLKPYPTDITRIKDHLAALIERFENVGESAREAIDTADEAGDAGTADILTAYSRSLDKLTWFLQSHRD